MTFHEIWHYIEKFIDKTIVWNTFGIAKEPMYWLRCHTFNRYHIIDISHQGDYRWGYCDQSHRIELAAFKCLVDFVEKESPLEFIDWDWDPEYKKVRDDFMEIYEWWTKGRALEQEKMNKVFDEAGTSFEFIEVEETKDLPKEQKMYSMESHEKNPQKYEEYKKLSDEFDLKHDRMFVRLIEIRKYLWT